MSKVAFKITKEHKIPHSYSTKILNKTKDKNSLSPTKDNSNFKKISGSGIVGTSGLSPIIIYKKTLKGNQNKEKYKIKRQVRNTNYISDGGLKEKLQKFNNGLGFCSSPTSMSQNHQMKSTKNKNKNHNLFFEENQKENQKEKENIPRTKKYNLAEKKLFSKTVRESNKRPIFPKNGEKIKNCYQTKNNFGVKYKNLHEVNKNQEENDKKYQEEKNKYINQLYENGIANEIRKYQVEKKMTPKEILNERKKVLLIDNGIELENELNNIEEERNMNEEIKEEENSKNLIEHNMIKSKTPSNNNLFKSQIEFNHNIISLNKQSLSPKSPERKKIYKPPVNQFEFLKKIKEEQQKLSSNDLRPFLNKKINYNNKSNSYSLNDSFRHKNINKNNNNYNSNNFNNGGKILKNNYINNNDKENGIYIQSPNEDTQSTNDNYPYSHKKSHRSTEELKIFLKTKRLKEKENRKSKEIENNKKLFVRFKNLYNLSMKDIMEEPYQKIENHQRGKMTKSKSNNNYNYNNNLIRKKKEVNEYYIGSEPSLKNNSTLVDQSEYFLHILESQQLLVNSKLKRIDNISYSETNEENTEENINNSKLNISKEQINKITDKESKRSENSSPKTTNVLNLSNYDDLKIKIDNTLKRVNQVFSKENIKRLKDTSNSNSNNSDTSNNIYNINNKSDNNTSSNDNNIKVKINNEIKKNIPENIKDLKVKTHELNIDTTNVGNNNNKLTNSEVNTKEKNVPSLSHTYSTNSNPNKKVEIEIEPRAVLNLVEIIKFIIQRKVFVKLYESYINHSIFQQYNIAFSYFVAICKHYPFRKIEEYANYRTYNFAFRQLFRPFTRKAFKYFIKNCYIKRKIEYLVELLSKILKLKILEKIYLYNQFNKVGKKDNQKILKIVLMKILNSLLKTHLKESFSIFKDKIKKIPKNNKKILIQEYKNNNKDKNKDNLIDDDEEKKENYFNKKYKNKGSEPSKEDKNEKINDKKNIKIENNNKKNKKINKNYLDEDNYFLDDEDNEENSIHRKADVSMKMKTFMHYTSENDSKSSIDIEPNSVDNDKLHQLNKILELRNRLLNDIPDDEMYGYGYGYGFDYDNLKFKDHSLESESHKSAKSLKDYLNKKKKYLNNNNSDFDNSSKKSGGKDIKDNKDIKDKNFFHKEKFFRDDKINKDKKENFEGNEKIDDIKRKNKNEDKKLEDKKIEDKKNININIDEDIKEEIKDKNNFNNSERKDFFKDKIKNKDNNKENIKDKDKENKDKEKINNKKEPNNEEKKRNIKIEIDDIPIIKNENINKYSTSEIDISADNEKNNDIDWEYNVSSKGNANQDNEKDKNDLLDEFSLEDIEDNTSRNKKENLNEIEKNGNEIKKEKINVDNNEKKNDESEKRTKSKESKKSDEDYGDFDDLSIDDDNDKKDIIKKEEKKENFNIISENKQDKSRNSKQDNNKEIKIDSNDIKIDEKNKKIENEEEKISNDKDKNKEKESINNSDKDKDKDSEIKEEEKKIKNLSSKSKIEILNSIKDINKLSDDLTEQIIKDILLTEIKSSKKKLIPTKKFKFDKFDKMNNANNLNNSLTNSYGSVGDFRTNSSNLSKEFSLGNIGQLSFHDDLISLNDSLMSNYSAFSVFNKTVKDKKKEHSLKLYLNKIAPKLIKLIYIEICEKYPLIYKNISKPLQNNSDKFMISLALQDGDMLKENYKCDTNDLSIDKIIDKEKILKKFCSINKNIRNKDNVTSDNFYDNMLNDCIIETAVELIEKERLYGKNGNPLKWSSRTHELKYKYNENEPKKFATYICKSIFRILHNRIGLINDNYDYMTIDQINLEKDRRLLTVIKKDLNDNEYLWNNLEIEETQIKVEATESILDQLYNEIIEILEHIQFSRIRPELYQNKSIYACEEIPKLSFQQTTTEEMNGIGENEDNVINA